MIQERARKRSVHARHRWQQRLPPKARGGDSSSEGIGSKEPKTAPERAKGRQCGVAVRELNVGADLILLRAEPRTLRDTERVW